MLNLNSCVENYFLQFSKDFDHDEFLDSDYILGIRTDCSDDNQYSLNYLLEISERTVFNKIKDNYFKYIIRSYSETDHTKVYFGCLDSELI